MNNSLLQARTISKIAALSVFSVVIGFAGFAAAEEQKAEPKKEAVDTSKSLSVPNPDSWWFEVQPYLWMSALRIEVDAGPIDADTDLDFKDVLDILDKGLMFHAEAGKGNWGGFMDFFWTRLNQDEDIGANGQIDAQIDQFFIELGGFYRFTIPVKNRTLTVDPLLGLRVGIAKNDVSLDVGPLSRDVESTDEWFDPMVGARARMQWTPKFSTSLRADLSGFHVGSDITWNVQSEMRYQFTDLFGLTWGYRYMQVQYNTDNDAQMTLTMNGPVLGMVFRF